jgi:elongation factor P--(R)-beta-lysine ligase
MPQAPPWWMPDIHADRQPFLRGRRRILAALRRLLEARGFIEVETAILGQSPGNEAHLHAFATEIVAPDGARARLYLHTSPEFACKKLLAAGERKIFEFARVFRNRERGALHHPEFTMLEWYRVGEPYEAVMADCADFVAEAAAAAAPATPAGATRFSFRGRSADPFAAPERLTVAAAFARHAGIDLLATLGENAHENAAENAQENAKDNAPDRDGFAAQARAAGIRVADDDSWSDIFSRVLVERVEPQLGNGRATILTEYPRVEAALARPCAADPRLAERFELFICGVELANGFGELTDPVEQRRRLDQEMARKERLYGERYPIDEEFIAALGHMPAACGCAMGFDRLVMLATGAARIDQVIVTPLP